MYIIELALVSKQFKSGLVSFRYPEKLSAGILVECTVSRRNAHAVVVRSLHVREAKMMMKSNDFELKELVIKRKKELFTAEQIDLLDESSKKLGTTLPHLLRELVTRTDLFFAVPPSCFASHLPLVEGGNHTKILTVELDTLSRFNYYNEQEYKSATCLIMPTKQVAKEFSKRYPEWKYATDSVIKKNLDSRFHGNDGQQKIVCSFDHVIISSFFSTIILDSCCSQQYHTHTNPFIPRGSVWAKLWQLSGKQVVLGDSLLPAGVETDESLSPANSNKTHSRASLQMISPDQLLPTSYSFLKYFFNEFLIDKKNQEIYKKILIWHERVGIGRSTFCPSCGYQEVCTNCAGNLKLEQEEGSALNILRCVSCSSTFETRDICIKCQGILLVQIPGIEILKKHVDDRPKLYKNFELVFTTSKDLPIHALSKFDLIVVPLLGSQLNNPSHNATEKTLRSLLSFSPTIPFLVHEELKKELQNLDWKKYLHQDLSIRKQAHLPPWGNLLEGSLVVYEKRGSQALRLIATFCKKEDIKILKGTEKLRISFKVLYPETTDFSETLFELGNLGQFEYRLYPKTNDKELPFF